MESLNLLLSLPQGALIATNLGVEGFAHHRSPGSGKYFQGRTLIIDLVLINGHPDFPFLDEGGWRDAKADTMAAIAAVQGGKKTKTALSNNAFSCTPIDAYRSCFLVKTGGQVMAMEMAPEQVRFQAATCHEAMTPDEVATAIGRPVQTRRELHLYMVLCPVEFIVLSSLQPEEYAWYATHRPGKIFRQVLFTELRAEHSHLVAESRYQDARQELSSNPAKKTKTIVTEDCINRVPFHAWVGYHREEIGGCFVADRFGMSVWRFPVEIPHAWDRAEG